MDTALICGETEKFWPRFPSAARLFPRSGVDAIPTGSGRSRWPSVQVNEARSQLELAHHNKLVAKFSRNILIQFCRCLALRTWFYVNGYVLVSWEWMGKKKQDAGAIASCPCFCVGFEKRICHHQMISIFRFPLCPLLPLRRPIFRKFPKKANPAQISSAFISIRSLDHLPALLVSPFEPDFLFCSLLTMGPSRTSIWWRTASSGELLSRCKKNNSFFFGQGFSF